MLKRFNWPNNKIRYFGLFLGTLIVLGSFFIGASYVLATDNNYWAPSCSDCDTNYSSCTHHFPVNFDWLPYDSNTYSMNNGHPECCGDDDPESTNHCYYFSDTGTFNCGSNTAGCCSTILDCVYNGYCYSAGSAWQPTAYSVGVASDKKSLCYFGYWADCDFSGTATEGITSFIFPQPEFCENQCGYNWSIGGESAAFGEYNSGTATECCGDDANEYYTQLCPGVSGVPRKCCNSSGDKINAAGNCVPLCSLPDLTITDVWTSPVSGNILPGNSVTLYATVKNNGAASAGSSTTLLGMGSSFPGGSTCGATTAALNADSQVDVSCAVTAPVCGSYTVGAEADTAHIITESDESNNVRTETGYQVNCGAPGVFNLTSPTNNAGCQPTGPTLQWSASTDPGGGAITYNLYYCQGASCSLPGTPNISGISGTTWSLSGLIVGATYRWNIIASDGFLQTSSGNGPFAFTINNLGSICRNYNIKNGTSIKLVPHLWR